MSATLPPGFELEGGGAPTASGLPPGFELEGPSTAEDMAKSAGVGLAKGTIGMAGLPGDAMRGFGLQGWVTKKMVDLGLMSQGEADRQQARYEKDFGGTQNPFPGSGDIQGAAEGVTGKFYEPKTYAGKITEGAAKFIPSAVTGPGGVVRNMAIGAAAGAGSEAAGRSLEGTGYEGPARFLAALTIGGVGALATAPRTAVSFLKQQLPSYVTDQAVAQAEALIKEGLQRGIKLTWPEALSQVTGRPVLNDLQRVLEGAKQTRATMQEAIGDRPGEVRRAAEAEAGRIAPPTTAPSSIGPAAGETAEGIVGDVRKGINNASKPYYTAAEMHQLTPTEMARVRALPGYEDAAKTVRNDPQLNRYVSGLPDNSVGFLNEVKKVLDQAAENAASPVQQGRNMQRAAGLGQDATAVREAAINSEAAVGKSAYADALKIQEIGRQRYLEPLLNGPIGKLASKDTTTKNAIEALFPASPVAGSQEEVRQAVSLLASRHPEVARQLVRAHVEAKLDEAFNAAGRTQEAAGFAGAGFAQRLTGSPIVETQRGTNFKAAVEALPNGKQIWPGIEKFLDVMRATGWRQPIGSKTAFNEAELHGMAHGNFLGNAASIAASPGEWMHVAHELWGRWQTGNNLRELARLITDPAAVNTFKTMARMPPGPQIAQTAARLTAGLAVTPLRKMIDKPRDDSADRRP